MNSPEAEIHSWSKDKLLLLEQYLHAYSIIMNRQRERWLRSYSYIDAFAGVGQYTDPDTRRYVDGSPLVALKCAPPFDEYRFIELMPSRLDYLRQRVRTEFPDRCVRFYPGDANETLCRTVATEITREGFRRGFVFLDPYGLGVDFATIKRLAEARAFDIFVNFSVMGINRILRRRQMPGAETLKLLARVMGDAEWAQDLYVRQGTLFEEENHVSRPRLGPAQVAQQYMLRVKKLFPFVSEPLLMRNSRKAPLYVLFLASHNETAVKITNDIFRPYEPLPTQLPT